MFLAMTCALPDAWAQTDGVWLCVDVMVLETVFGIFPASVEAIRKAQVNFVFAPAKDTPGKLICPATRAGLHARCSADSLTFS